MTPPRLSKLESSCWFAVVEAYQACNRRYSTMLREFDLTSSDRMHSQNRSRTSSWSRAATSRDC